MSKTKCKNIAIWMIIMLKRWQFVWAIPFTKNITNKGDFKGQPDRQSILQKELRTKKPIFLKFSWIKYKTIPIIAKPELWSLSVVNSGWRFCFKIKHGLPHWRRLLENLKPPIDYLGSPTNILRSLLWLGDSRNIFNHNIDYKILISPFVTAYEKYLLAG